MSPLAFILASARHYWRGHLGLLLGAFLASAILSGSLLVGDSVRASLRRVADLRLGHIQSGVIGGDRWFTEKLAREAEATPLILTLGSTSSTSSQVRVNGVQVLGVNANFWKLSHRQQPVTMEKGQIALNEALARKLSAKVGDTVIVRLERPSAISRDAPLSGNANEAVTLRREVAAIVPAEDLGTFQLVAAQTSPDSAFVPLADLQTQLEMNERVNALVAANASAKELDARLEQAKTLEDFALNLAQVQGERTEWEIRTDRVFLDPSLAQKLLEKQADAYGVLTYLVNGLVSAKGSTPYSMITATDAPLSQAAAAEAKEPGIVINQWLADDQKLAIGDTLDLRYFVVGLGRELKEATERFTVRGVIPMDHPGLNRQWTPNFPGVSDVDNCRDWDPGIPMDTKKIRDQDEKYWDDYQGTPKGFIRLAAGQKLWGNRFGNLTSIRFADRGQEEAKLRTELVDSLKLADIGLTARHFSGEAQAAARGSVDFGGLFVGLSLFLIVAALVFASLLFLFTLERRASQTGVLLAMGWTPKQARRALLGEAGVIAVLGALLGVWGGEGYTRLALRGLSSAWADAAQGLPLIYAGSPVTQAAAGIGAVLALLLTLGWVSRKLFRQPVRDLLHGHVNLASLPSHRRSQFAQTLPWSALVGAIVLIVAGTRASAPEAVAGLFFGSGFLLLIAGLAAAAARMQHVRGLADSLWQIGVRNLARRPARSLAVMGMMAGGIFLVTAVNAFRLDAGDGTDRHSGTGGFALIGESSLPIYEDLNSAAGRDAFGLDETLLEDVTIIPFRLREGDDASCLNLNRAQKPVLVGVDPSKLADRFSFVGSGTWQRLNASEETAAIADQATAMWGLGLGEGGTLEYASTEGGALSVTLRGFLSGSVLQGKMLVSEAAFLRAYPNAAGYRFFLIDAPEAKIAEVSAHLTRQLESRGLALEPARQRLQTYLSVQNTYIGIFTVLGGLGVLLGTAGLGILVARHVLERRGELGLMQAVGFQPRALRRLVLGEHASLLTAGLLLGALSAAIAVWPQLAQSGSDLPLGFLSVLLLCVLAFGILICWLAVARAVRGQLVESIRRE